jgi:hypothetical protein
VSQITASKTEEGELKESMKTILKNELVGAPPGELQELIDTIKTTPIKLHISTNRALAIASTILERFEMPTRKH